MKRHKYHYGEDPSQWGELFLPDVAAPKGVVVVIHGGYWRSQYGAELGRAAGQGPRRARHGGLEPGVPAGRQRRRLAPHLRRRAGRHRQARWTSPTSTGSGWTAWWPWATRPAATSPSGRRAAAGSAGLGAPDADRQLLREATTTARCSSPASSASRGCSTSRPPSGSTSATARSATCWAAPRRNIPSGINMRTP